jgi:dienelactone hydrolase
MSLFRILCLLLPLALSVGCGDDAPTESESEQVGKYITQEFAQFRTSDGFTIGGTWFASQDAPGRLPVLILLHMRGANHALWDPIVPDFVQEGYRVLALDIRGHGLSRDQNGVDRPLSRFEDEDKAAMPLDVGGAIGYIKSRPDADSTRIGVLGVILGANIAYVSSGIYPEIKATVAVSVESRPTMTVLLGEGIPNFDPHGVLYLAAFGDGYAYTSSEALAASTRAPVRVVGYQGSASGVQVLNKEAARDEVMAWFREHLR